MLACALLLCVVGRAVAFTTPLDEYIALPDPNYSYFDTVRRCQDARQSQQHSDTHPAQGYNFSGPGYDAYVLNMTSQQWLTPGDSSRSIWFVYN